MKILNELEQGSPAWVAYRKTVIGSSEVAALMGVMLTIIDGILDNHFSEYHGRCVFEFVESKHSWETFHDHFKDEEHLSQLFDQLRWMKSQLEDLQTLATGDLSGDI